MASNKVLFIVGVVLFAGVSASKWDHEEEEHYDSHPRYKFEYSVHDPHTHDFKSQEESRDGDHVKGYYELKEADGSTRQVHYTADGHSGFHAKVTKDGHPIFDSDNAEEHHYPQVHHEGHGSFGSHHEEHHYPQVHHEGHGSSGSHHDEHHYPQVHHEGHGSSGSHHEEHHATSTQNLNSYHHHHHHY